MEYCYSRPTPKSTFRDLAKTSSQRLASRPSNQASYAMVVGIIEMEKRSIYVLGVGGNPTPKETILTSV